jgi:thymidylate kinase
VILLTVDPATALARKPSVKPETISAKAQAVVEAASRASADGVVVVDATRPLEDVVGAVEAEIWKRL